jgi:hypothetical protein
MTTLLGKAMARAANLPEEGQNFVVSVILHEPESNDGSDVLFRDPPDKECLRVFFMV